jgi:hypothetical protein
VIPVFLLLSFAPAECSYDDHRDQAECYIAAAAEAQKAHDHEARVHRLYLAHREYLHLFDETHSPADLCRARTVLAKARRLKPTPPPLVERFRKSAKDTSARERAAGVDCTPRKKDPDERLLAAKQPTEPEPAGATAELSVGDGSTEQAGPLTTAASGAEATVTAGAPEAHAGEPVTHEPPALAASAPDAEPSPAGAEGPEAAPAQPPLRARDIHKRRARLGGSVACFLASGGFAGAMAGILVKRGELTQELWALDAKIDREGRDATPAEYAQERQGDRRYGVLTITAAVMGIGAVGGIVGGVLLLPKKPRQVLALPWTSPHAAGLTLEGRF